MRPKRLTTGSPIRGATPQTSEPKVLISDGFSGGRVFMDCAGHYKPGDLPPDGYLQWSEWAEVQRKAGIKQKQCCVCCLWKTPQELSDKVHVSNAETRDRRGNYTKVKLRGVICTKCAEEQKPLTLRLGKL